MQLSQILEEFLGNEEFLRNHAETQDNVELPTTQETVLPKRETFLGYTEFLRNNEELRATRRNRLLSKRETFLGSTVKKICNAFKKLWHRSP